VNTLGYQMRTMRRLVGYRRAASYRDENRRVHVVHYMGKVKPWMMTIKDRYIYLNILRRRHSFSELRAVALYWRIEARMRLRQSLGLWRRPLSHQEVRTRLPLNARSPTPEP
jgi:lipopolysaccharide biosynthesis glycosyltransferase